MNRYEYSASGVKHAFWFMEFRKVVSLLADGNDWNYIKTKVIEENLFAAPTKERAVSMFSVVSSRIKTFDKSFYHIFMDCDVASQKLFALVAAMNYDRLFGEFVYEVVREKMIVGNNELADSDFSIFFRNKQEQSDVVSKWTDATIRRLGATYKSMLYEAGVINKAKNIREIYKPLPDPAMEHWMQEQGMTYQLKAITGVR